MTETEAPPTEEMTTAAPVVAETAPPPSGLTLIPAEASSEEDLAREPNTYEEATEGPHPQISSTTVVEWTKPDGDTFQAPLANSETYERKGYTRGAETDLAAETEEAPSG